MRKAVWFSVTAVFVAFLWARLTGPIHFFEVADNFAVPKVVEIPQGLDSVSAKECAVCHEDIARQWETSVHANAWRDPYFRVDWIYDGAAQICLNCHTPLVNQQRDLVLGFRDSDRLDPILQPNPGFDPELKNEGVTCAVCHIEDGVIVGPTGAMTGAHPVRKDSRFTDGNGICKRCHMVKGNRWEVFMKLPPCGNFAEIEETGRKADCVKCHMPESGQGSPSEKNRIRKSHTWRGGHDREMVKNGLTIELKEEKTGAGPSRRYALLITNTGAGHRIPTGTPDRHLEVSFRLIDSGDRLVKEQTEFLERVILWRPFIIDLWDTRIRFNETRRIAFDFSMEQNPAPAYVVAEVKYGLLHESRRKKIGYQNAEPIKYTVFSRKIALD